MSGGYPIASYSWATASFVTAAERPWTGVLASARLIDANLPLHSSISAWYLFVASTVICLLPFAFVVTGDFGTGGISNHLTHPARVRTETLDCSLLTA